MKTMSTILIVKATMLATPAVVYAHDASAAQLHETAASKMNKHREPRGRYAAVNGLNMYYEIHGRGRPWC